jgi:hypothetical protein
MTVISGLLCFLGGGSDNEGVVAWAFQEDVPPGYVCEPYEGIYILKNGDQLKVFRPDGSVLWQGTIDLELLPGRFGPGDPKFGQYCQRGCTLRSQWAHMFYGPDATTPICSDYLRAELTKKPD